MDNLIWVYILAPGAVFPALLGLLTVLSLLTPVRLPDLRWNKLSILVGLPLLPFFYIVGLIVVFSLAFPLKAPADTSNRFNRLRLWWFATSAPHRFVKYYGEPFFEKASCRIQILWDVIVSPEQFTIVYPWMRGDEVDNMGRFWTKS